MLLNSVTNFILYSFLACQTKIPRNQLPSTKEMKFLMFCYPISKSVFKVSKITSEQCSFELYFADFKHAFAHSVAISMVCTFGND